MKKDNLELWNKVSTTNPNHTKKVNQRGGFTAISAMYQIKQATEQFGPYGQNWGIKGCNYEYIRDSKNNIIELTLEAFFYYPGGIFEISSDIRYNTGQDCRKKILTDVTTKALSKIGFNADVFLGMYDDNKYINQVKEMYKPVVKASVSGAGLPTPKSKKNAMSAKAFKAICDRLARNESGLIEKVFNHFVLSDEQQKIIKSYGTTE